MELFSELYGCYYAVVGEILREASAGGVSRPDIEQIVAHRAFDESGLHLIPRLLGGDWSLLAADGDGRFRSRLRHADLSTPLTALQKSWLKALLADARMRLFLTDGQLDAIAAWLADVPPLWSPEDFHTYDRALDGDPYADPAYRARFATVLAAIPRRAALAIGYRKGKGGVIYMHFVPTQLQYSAKDDKFRVIGRRLQPSGKATPYLLNMGRLTEAGPSTMIAPAWITPGETPPRNLHTGEVLLHIWPERNALERCMTQFAFYEKETWADLDGQGHFCRLRYPSDDASELLIRLLSFGPVVRVLAPEGFVAQMRERVANQAALAREAAARQLKE